MQDLLEQAIRYGLPFNLYMERSRVREFQDVICRAIPGEPKLLMARHLANINGFLSRPETPNCIPRGVIRFVAEVYCPDLVDHFARGPSLQVSEFNRGESRLFTLKGDETFWTTDHISQSQEGVLLGLIPGDLPATDCPNPKLVWRTKSEWTTYFRGGQTGKNRILDAEIIPSSKDFEEGPKLFEVSYPSNWSPILVKDMAFPEKFVG
ncbi:hypothetical protein K438DRAFT_1767163 [Mycena galopus ATCC 62051]|nr:hypothetical protein K438DRAFT_1767163 [Mycena galopus ATCC 62051]